MIMLIARDEGGTYNSDIYDSLTQGNFTYTPDPVSGPSFVMTSGNGQLTQLIPFIPLTEPYGIQSNISFENIQNYYGIANLVMTDGARRGQFKTSGGALVPPTFGVGNVNGVRIEKIDPNGNDALLSYNGTSFIQMSSNPFSDGSQVAGWAFNGNGNDINGNYNITTTGYLFTVDREGFLYGCGYGQAFCNGSSIYSNPYYDGLITPFRLTTGAAFSLSFKFILMSQQYSNGNAGTLIHQDDAFIIICQGTTTLSIVTINNGTVSGSVAITTTSLVLGVPYHIVMTYNGSGTLLTYVNGSLQTTVTGHTISPSIATDFLSVGGYCMNSTYNYPYSFEVSQLRVFNRVLLSTEAASLYNDVPPLPTIPVTSLYQSEICSSTGNLRLAANNAMVAPIAKFPLKGYIGDSVNTAYQAFYGGLCIPPSYIQFNGASGNLYRGSSFSTVTNGNALAVTTLGATIRFSPVPQTSLTIDIPLKNAVSNGGLTIKNSNNTASVSSMAGCSFAINSGKVYWEVLVNSCGGSGAMIAGAGNTFPTDYVGSLQAGVCSYGLLVNGSVYSNGGTRSYTPSISSGNVVGVALDMVNGAIYFSVNGVWGSSGNANPATQTNPAYTGVIGPITPQFTLYFITDQVTFRPNAAQQTYTAPSGFTALGNIAAQQCLWKCGSILNGLGVGINFSGNMVVTALNAGAATTGTCAGTSMVSGSWYKVVTTPTSISLYTDSGTLISQTTGLSLSCGTFDGNAKESVGASILGSVLSQTTGNSEYFYGKISDITITNTSNSSTLLQYQFGAARMMNVCPSGLNCYLPYASVGPSSMMETTGSGSIRLASATYTPAQLIDVTAGFPRSSLYTSSFTFSVLFTPEISTAGNYNVVFGCYGIAIEFYVKFINGNITFSQSSTNVSTAYYNGKNPTINSTYQIVGVVNAITGFISLYVNSQYIGKSTWNTTAGSATGPYYVGGGYYTSSYPQITGRIENAQLFPYAASGDALQTIFNQGEFTGLSGQYSTTIFNPVGVSNGNLAEALYGIPLTSINVTDTPNSQTIAYSFSFDRLTYSQYVSSAWVPIASCNASVNGQNTNWWYWNGTAWIVAPQNNANCAISNAVKVLSSHMNSTAVNALTQSILTTGGYISASGILETAVTLYSTSATASPEVQEIYPNNSVYQFSQVFPLSSYSGITTSSIDVQMLTATTAQAAGFTLYAFVTGMSGWVQYTSGMTNIPGITAGMTTTGKSLQVMVVWNLSTGITPQNTQIRVIIT